MFTLNLKATIVRKSRFPASSVYHYSYGFNGTRSTIAVPRNSQFCNGANRTTITMAVCLLKSSSSYSFYEYTAVTHIIYINIYIYTLYVWDFYSFIWFFTKIRFRSPPRYSIILFVCFSACSGAFISNTNIIPEQYLLFRSSPHISWTN